MNVTGGATDVTTYFQMRLLAGGDATGLTIADFDLSTTRSGAATAAKVDAVALAAADSAHTDNRMIEVDPTDCPGLYRVDFADVFAAGVKEVICTVKHTSCFTESKSIEIDAPVNAAAIADAVWDEDATAHQTAGTFGQAIGDPGADANTIYGAVVTGAAGATIAADIVTIDGIVDSILTDTAEIGAAGAGLTALASAVNLATVDGIVDTIAIDVAGLDGAAMRGTDGAYTGTPPTTAAITTAVLAGVVEGTTTVKETLMIANAHNAGKTDGFVPGTATVGHVRNLADTKNRITATPDTVGNRTAITLDLT